MFYDYSNHILKVFRTMSSNSNSTSTSLNSGMEGKAVGSRHRVRV